MIEVIKGGVRLHLFIQPKASKNEVIGEHNGELKIKIKSPPVDGKANECVVEFMSQLFSCPKRDISIIRGEISRHKTVEILGIDAETAQKILNL